MDVFDFINSRDVAQHLRDLDYKFSLLEKCFVISRSYKATIKQKQMALKQILATEQDQPVPARRWTKQLPSLFEQIQKMMDAQNKVLQRFYDQADGVYRFRYLCKGDQSFCEDYKRVYPCFDKCLDAFKKQAKQFGPDEIVCYEIKMQSLHNPDVTVKLLFAPDDEVADFDSTGVLDEEDTNALCLFEQMWFAFPLPFKPGDIIQRVPYYGREGCENLLVFESASTWTTADYIANGYTTKDKRCLDGDKLCQRLAQYGDDSDMNVCGYFCSEDGTIWHEVTFCTLDFEFFKGELKNGYRNMKVVSEFLQGKIALDDMLKLHEHVKHQFVANDEKRYIHLLDDYLQKLGID